MSHQQRNKHDHRELDDPDFENEDERLWALVHDIDWAVERAAHRGTDVVYIAAQLAKTIGHLAVIQGDVDVEAAVGVSEFGVRRGYQLSTDEGLSGAGTRPVN